MMDTLDTTTTVPVAPPGRARAHSLDELPKAETVSSDDKNDNHPEQPSSASSAPRRRKKPSRSRSSDGLEHMTSSMKMKQKQITEEKASSSSSSSHSKKSSSRKSRERGLSKSKSSDGLELMRNSTKNQKNTTTTTSLEDSTSTRPSSKRRGVRKAKSSDGLEFMKQQQGNTEDKEESSTDNTSSKKPKKSRQRQRGVQKSKSSDGLELMSTASQRRSTSTTSTSTDAPLATSSSTSSSPPKKRGIRKTKSSDGLDFVKTSSSTNNDNKASSSSKTTATKRSKPKRSQSSDGLEAMKSFRAKQQQQHNLETNEAPRRRAHSDDHVPTDDRDVFPPFHSFTNTNNTITIPPDEDVPETFHNEESTVDVGTVTNPTTSTTTNTAVAPAPLESPSLEIKFADGIKETRHADGSIEVRQPNGRRELWQTNGILEIRHPDGTMEHQQHDLQLHPVEAAPLKYNDDNIEPTCCGLRRKWFLLIVGIVFVMAIGAIVAVVFVLGGGSDDSSSNNNNLRGTSAPVAPIAPTTPDGDIFVAPTVSPTTQAPTGPTTAWPTTSPTEITCPKQHCPNAIVTTVPPIQESCSLTMDSLDSFVYSDTGDVLIEYLGPSNPSDAAAMVITASHGGSLEPTYIADRTADNPLYCIESACRVNSDSFTRELALEIAQGFIRNYCKVPYIVLNNLHRGKLDANREIGEAAQGDATAEAAWLFYHTAIAEAQQRIANEFGTEMNSQGIEGIRGMLLDVHGYTGFDWDPENGSPMIQWGYNINEDSMNPQNYCPIDTRTTGRLGTFSFGRFLPNQSYECLIRGPQSLGTRVAALYSNSDSPMCGMGLPSFEHPSPTGATMSRELCNDMRTTGQPCNYFEGGDTVRIHEYLNWTQADAESTSTDPGILMNTVQAEFPRCLTWATLETQSTVHNEIANAISIGFCSFMKDLFPGVATCGQ